MELSRSGQPGPAPCLPVLVNGQPGLLVTSAGIPDNVIVIDLGHDDRIETIRLIRNPDKLAHLVTS